MTDPFLDEVAEWPLSAGWALFFASSTYAAVLRLATAKAAKEDGPGELVSSVRRARAGVNVDENQVSAGF